MDSALPPTRIAICEDDDDLREILATGLSFSGFEVSGAASAEVLDVLLAENPVDIAILDIGLPGEDGFSAASRLRRTQPDLGIVMLTARSMLDDRIRGRGLGADLYFVKPVDLRELAAALDNLQRRLARSRSETRGVWCLRKGRTVLEAPDGRTIDLNHQEFFLLDRLLAVPTGVALEREAPVPGFRLALDPPFRPTAWRTSSAACARRQRRRCRNCPFSIRTRHGLGYAFLAPGRLEP